ncbi:MAG: efflux RND transporter periplasmic adaptor subunit [Phycisphaerae bacterium]
MDAITSEKTAPSTPAPTNPPPAAPPAPPRRQPAPQRKTRWRLWVIVGIVAVLVLVFGIPEAIRAFTTVSTDDAYVNGHYTMVAPRVAGQVTQVHVEDNNRVRKGDLLFQLDKEPYQVQVNIAQAAVTAAQSDVAVAEAQARGLIGQARAARFNLQHAIEDVDNEIALLRARVATVESAKATLQKAQGDYDRAVPLVKTGNISPDEFESRKEALAVAKAKLDEALESVYQVRVSLGLPPKPEQGNDLTQVPPDLDQTFSSVREAEAALIQAASQLGITTSSYNQSPKNLIAEFMRRDPTGDIDRIYQQILKDAPSIKQSQAKLLQAQRNLDEAKLNLSYTDVRAEIDGVITRRNINPGDNVVAGQAVMAIRSLTDIWIDANFKETQLSKLRIGQPVDLEVDMYGRHHEFKGRVSGFTMGTGSTLALLPAENATGNFVKVVQRLPVRIDLLDYNPDKQPLFVGTSVTPYVHINDTPEGPDAGKILQPYIEQSTTTAPATAPNTQP